MAPIVSGKYISAGIRYTGIDGWFGVRGGRLQADGRDQYHKLAPEKPIPCTGGGRSSGWGDGFIARGARHQDVG